MRTQRKPLLTQKGLELLMKKNHGKVMACLVSLMLVFSLLSVPAFASEAGVSSLSDLSSLVYSHLVNRDASFSVRFVGDTNLLRTKLNQLLEDSVGTDDYLKYNLMSWSVGYKGYQNDVTVSVQVEYQTNREQEDYVSQTVESLLPQILGNASGDSEKLRLIHDAICNRVSYDESLSRYSAYAGLHDGNTVCQGYSLLMDKMLTRAGVLSRIITGKLKGGPHAWNLVFIDGQWLHVDVTNDDSLRSDKFYLASDDVMLNHSFVWDSAEKAALINSAPHKVLGVWESSAASAPAKAGTVPVVSNSVDQNLSPGMEEQPAEVMAPTSQSTPSSGISEETAVPHVTDAKPALKPVPATIKPKSTTSKPEVKAPTKPAQKPSLKPTKKSGKTVAKSTVKKTSKPTTKTITSKYSKPAIKTAA
jgi:hypothetical protein